jgi:hypothetical protein
LRAKRGHGDAIYIAAHFRPHYLESAFAAATHKKHPLSVRSGGDELNNIHRLGDQWVKRGGLGRAMYLERTRAVSVMQNKFSTCSHLRTYCRGQLHPRLSIVRSNIQIYFHVIEPPIFHVTCVITFQHYWWHPTDRPRYLSGAVTTINDDVRYILLCSLSFVNQE